jgi:hypothetical protein
MTTKIFVSQITNTNPDGTFALLGSYIILGSTGPYWTNNLSFIPSGYAGSAGAQGDPGYAGSVGFSGYNGSLGYDGSVGYQGSAGLGGTGYSGSQGYDGSSGYQGSAGFTGSTGAGGAGFKGSIGDPGPAGGTTGYNGSTGYSGSVGVGYSGSLGYNGSAGYNGSIGYTGSPGAPGAFAALGYTGSVGPQGPGGGYTGSIGDAGYIGSLGYTGSDGIGYTGSAGIGYTGSASIVPGYTGSAGIGYTGSSATTSSIAFTNLTDVPASYTTYNGNFLRVNAAATGIVFDSNTYVTNSMVTDVGFKSSNLLMNGNLIVDPIIKGYGETLNNLGNVTNAGVRFIPVKDGNIVSMTLTDSPVGITIDSTGMVTGKLYTVTLFITQDSTGSRIIDWTGLTLYWPTSENIPPAGPTLSTTAGYTDVIVLYTLNAGTSWRGVLTLKGYVG